ncbi:uncharacterized protein [Asterias amurensis]|uniref:uncharacterized protein n=1 Tax=Asterias amurensis TaxID=7602 RepID=UPI003AB1FB06
MYSAASTMTKPITPEQITTESRLRSSDQAPSSTPWIVAFVILAAISFVIIIILILRDARKNRLIKSLRTEKEPRVTKPDPYMELQPTDDKNRVYTEPTTTEETIPTEKRQFQDTYYQPVEVENDSPEYDYARPEGSTNTSYEAVRVPKSSAEKQYQNINN